MRIPECSAPRCGEGRIPSPDNKGCMDKNECIDYPCLNGGRCINQDPRFRYRCICPDGFWGENCELVQEGQTLKLSMGALAAILVCLLIILGTLVARKVAGRSRRDRLKLFVFHSAVLVLVFVVYNRRRESHIKYPGPDDDVRENIINYDDEGGGEDDMTAFDITPLQIPIGGPIPEMGGKLPPCKIPCESFLSFFLFYSRSISDGIFHPMSF